MITADRSGAAAAREGEATRAGLESTPATASHGSRSRWLMLNHWYHHRGQLTVYSRVLDVPPAVCGASAPRFLPCDRGFRAVNPIDAEKP
jgi:uncharacterized damage-inducible protein DinB